ncbi:MAG: hypothetical protein ACE5HE_07865 [Phycisphaerae bacterium]
MFEVNKSPTAGELRKFGWAMLLGFGVLGLVLWLAPWVGTGDTAVLEWAGTGKQMTAVFLWLLGTALIALSFVSRRVTRVVYIAWMSVVVPIGVAMSTLLLTLLFVFLLPVFSVAVRFGDPLRKRRTAEGSYWEDYKHYEPTLERMKRPF